MRGFHLRMRTSSIGDCASLIPVDARVTTSSEGPAGPAGQASAIRASSSTVRSTSPAEL